MIDDELIKVLQTRINKLEQENIKLRNFLKNLKTRFVDDNTWSNYFSDVIDEMLEEYDEYRPSHDGKIFT